MKKTGRREAEKSHLTGGKLPLHPALLVSANILPQTGGFAGFDSRVECLET